MQTAVLEKPEECQQLQPGRQHKQMSKPELNAAKTLTPRTTSMLIMVLSTLPTHTGWWETIPLPNQMESGSSAAAVTNGSSLANRRLILSRDENVPLPNRMDDESVSLIDRVLFHHQALADIRIMNTRKNAKGVMGVIVQQNATVEMALQYCDIISMVAMTGDKGVIHIDQN